MKFFFVLFLAERRKSPEFRKPENIKSTHKTKITKIKYFWKNLKAKCSAKFKEERKKVPLIRNRLNVIEFRLFRSFFPSAHHLCAISFARMRCIDSTFRMHSHMQLQLRAQFRTWAIFNSVSPSPLYTSQHTGRECIRGYVCVCTLCLHLR